MYLQFFFIPITYKKAIFLIFLLENVWPCIWNEIYRIAKCCQCFCLKHNYYDCKNELWKYAPATLFINWNHCFYWIAAIWKILDLLQGEDDPDAHHIDDVMKRHLIDYISRLNNICSDDLSVLHSRTHWLMWVFPNEYCFSKSIRYTFRFFLLLKYIQHVLA